MSILKVQEIQHTNATSALTISTGGNVTVPSGDLIVDTNTLVVDASANKVGIGTASPATAELDVAGKIRASSGMLFGTDTADVNLLDDYEEGTWTVNIKKGGGALAVSTRYGNYIRVGKLLWISFYWLNTSISTSGSSDYTVEGMPFDIDFGGSSGYQFVPSGYFNIGSTNVFNSEPHRWQANATDALTMYGASSTDNVSSALLQMHGAGVLQVA